MGRPISGKHAIEVVAFVVAFEKPFSANSIESLMALQESMKGEYPIFNTAQVMQMHIDGNKVQSPSSAPAGVTLKTLQPNGRPAWMIRATANSIAVSCYVYERWNDISQKALSDLIQAVSIAADDQNPVETIALQTVDRFVESSKDAYDISGVFNTDSPLLTQHAKESGKLWHVHQGWFEKTDSDNQLLNILNLNTNDSQAGIITTIDHTIRLHLQPLKAAVEIATLDFITPVFNNLHQNNKEILAKLLNDKQCEAIKL